MKSPRFNHADLASLGLAALGLGLSALLYPRLPEQVPVHFNWQGVPDGWIPRTRGAFLLPVLAFVNWVLLRHSGPLLPARLRAALARSPMDVVALRNAALLTALHLIMLHVALGRAEAVGTPLALVCGVSWLLSGQLIPRLRRNPFAGFRNPWALSSDEVWQRTQRFGGYSLTLGGLATLGLAPFSTPAALGALLVSGIAPAVYSFLLSTSSPARER
ncbi:DUF1648 domain-containing protein [Archangium minus]|uniref:DUF1648 domain-containing protein n=1 Tax=Archangium minus TaxID=83450 RepID=A0ABY9WHZ8_9BACT|nr:DUF1648 domain-containing protein [Archangium minus]